MTFGGQRKLSNPVISQTDSQLAHYRVHTFHISNVHFTAFGLLQSSVTDSQNCCQLLHYSYYKCPQKLRRYHNSLCCVFGVPQGAALGPPLLLLWIKGDFSSFHHWFDKVFVIVLSVRRHLCLLKQRALCLFVETQEVKIARFQWKDLHHLKEILNCFEFREVHLILVHLVVLWPLLLCRSSE